MERIPLGTGNVPILHGCGRPRSSTVDEWNKVQQTLNSSADDVAAR